MPKKTIFQIKGAIHDVGEVREGDTRKGDPFAARTILIDPQDGSAEPLAFDFYRQGENKVWVNDNFRFENGDLVLMSFTIQGSFYETRNGNKIPKTTLRVWKVEPVNNDGRVTAKKPKQHTEATDEEDDLPF